MHPVNTLSLPPALAGTLEGVVTATGASRHPWWIIGSAATVLQGARPLDAADVDVVMSPEDARRLLRERGLAVVSDGGSDRFRSEVFGRLTDSPLPIDIMGAFHIRRGAEWVRLRPTTREAITFPFGAVFTPTLPELIEITRNLGRPKDLARAQMLEALR